ncbi:MAG: hypothetical protein ABI551_13780 [Polyangiaceae bacterium]
MQWTTGGQRNLSASMSLEGRNFSLSSKTIGTSDYVHVALAHYVGAQEIRDAREVVSADGGDDNQEGVVITGLAPFVPGVSPDGVGVALGTDARVYVASGWSTDNGSAGGQNVLRSSLAETGGTGGAFAATFANTSATPSGANPVRNRLLLPMPNGRLLRLWTSTNVPTDADDLLASTSPTDGSSATTPTRIFGTDPKSAPAVASQNDWGACVVGTNVELVRRTFDGPNDEAFDFMIFAADTWTKGPSIPSDQGKRGSGVVTMTDGKSLLVFAIGADASNPIRVTKFDGTSWSPWRTLVGTPATRSYLSANGCGQGGKAGLIWTEGAAVPYRVVGLEVATLF